MVRQLPLDARTATVDWNKLFMAYAPVDRFGFAYLKLCSLKHHPKTMQLGLLTREIFTVSKVKLRVKEVA